MAKSRNGKVREQSRLRRSIDERKHKKHLGRLADEIVGGVAIWYADTYPEGDDEEAHAPQPARDRMITIPGTIVEDPDDPVQVRQLARLGEMIDAAGGELSFGPGEFTIGPDDDADLGDDSHEEDSIDEELFDDPLFDQAIMVAYPKIVGVIGEKAFEYVNHLLDRACLSMPSVSDGRFVQPDEDGFVPEDAVDYVCDLFALPVEGPREGVASALRLLQEGTTLADRLRSCGIVGNDDTVVTIPGVLMLEELCGQVFAGVRMALATASIPTMGVRGPGTERAYAPDALAGIMDLLGGIPLAGLHAGCDDHFAGAMLAVRVHRVGPDAETETDWLLDRKPDGTDADDVWLGWTRESFAASGVTLSTPMDVGTAAAEAAQMAIEGFFDRESRAQSLPSGAEPDRTVVLRSDVISMFLWHEGPARLVGPLAVPLTSLLREPEGFQFAVEDLGGFDVDVIEDPTAYAEALRECRRLHDEAREREAVATSPEETPMTSDVADEPVTSTPHATEAEAPLPTGDVIPFRPRDAAG